ncbi:MAG TPA: hypothetical protein VJQ06_10800 [Rhizomicrobium sp.]|nr:hypothetical protein [Rhizomicrobium sp.]
MDHETLDAFVDGELPQQEMARIAALLESQPELKAYVLKQEQLRAALRFEEVLRQPPPSRLVETAQQAPVSWQWRLQAVLGRRFVSRSLVPAATALLAGLIIGTTTSGGDLVLSQGQMLARGNLAQALDTKLASSGYSGEGPRIGISFRERGGKDCRTFASAGQAGLACHQNGDWVIGTLVAQSPESGGTYRMAGSEMPDAVRRAVEATIQGAPFDAIAEAQARADGWTGK